MRKESTCSPRVFEAGFLSAMFASKTLSSGIDQTRNNKSFFLKKFVVSKSV
jgi:hypothetical protein